MAHIDNSSPHLKLKHPKQNPFPTHIGKPNERVHETPSQGILSYSPIPLLLWPQANPAGKQRQTSWGAADRRRASPERVSRTPLRKQRCGSCSTAKLSNRTGNAPSVRWLSPATATSCPITPIREEWEGAERRPSREYPGCALLVQWGKGLDSGVLEVAI
jgi:hypothetical protein